MIGEPATPTSIDRHLLADELKRFARELGFDLVGICRAEPSRHAEYFRKWLAAGRNASMKWLENRVDERVDPTVYLPGAKSVISVAINYFPGAAQVTSAPAATQSDEGSHSRGRVARYALGDDYHDVLKPKLFALADRIRQHAPEAQCKCGVDTAPILERELAARAGIGWIGKNTLVLNEKIGSWILLGEVFTTLDLPPDEPATNHCGTCSRCIDACPTNAIVAPYQLDARTCISYLTIEDRSPTFSEETSRAVGDWIFGCDICQEVCPFNSKAPATTEVSFVSRFLEPALDAREVSTWNGVDYQTALKRSAIKRVKLPILQRNARAVLQNKSHSANDAGGLAT